MPNLWTRLFRRSDEIQRFSLDEWMRLASQNRWGFGPTWGGATTYAGGKPSERVENSFSGYVWAGYKQNPIVFGIIKARSDIFSEARFIWRKVTDGRPGDLFWDPALAVLAKPWPNGTTGELLTRMIQDVDLAGNFYAVRDGDRLRRLRPDWVQIVLSGDPRVDVDVDVVGYLYTPGSEAGGDGQAYLPGEVCHWSPIPDPDAMYRGMSWVTPVVREIEGDKAATDHKLAFFANGATLGPIIKAPAGITVAQFKEFIEASNAAHQGAGNAYRPMYVGGGADVSLAQATMQQIDFKSLTGSAETRMCVAARLPAVLAGVSEGLQGSSLNAGNYNAAKRSFVDGTLRSLWRSACAALATIVDVPDDAELWWDERDIAYLREDQQDLAQIQQTQAATLASHIAAGWTPETALQAVTSDDLSVMKHSGMMSVQLQPPGAPGEPGADPAAAQDAAADEYQQALDEFRSDLSWRDEVVRFDPSELRVEGGEHGGEWTSGGVLKDVLKLGSRIDLADGESLAGSDKLSADNGSIRIAAVDHGGKRSLRLGIGDASFGGRDDEAGPWRAGRGDIEAENARRAPLRAEMEALESAPSSPENDKRYAALADMDLGEVYASGHTASLDAPAAAKLSSTLRDALAAGKKRQAEFDAQDDELARLDNLFSTATPEEWDAVNEQYQALKAQIDRNNGDHDVFAEGVIPGEWADVRYQVSLDDPDDGVQTILSAVPHGQKEVGDEHANLDPAEAAKLVRLLDKMSGTVSRSMLLRADYYDIRINAGAKGGGRFRRISDVIGEALTGWLDAKGDRNADPLEPFLHGSDATVKARLRKASKELGVEPAPRASIEELKLGLLKDARARYQASHGRPHSSEHDGAEPVKAAKKATKRAPAKAAPSVPASVQPTSVADVAIDSDSPDFERLAALANAKTVADLRAIAAANNVRIPSYIKSKEDMRRHLALEMQYPPGMNFDEYEAQFAAPSVPTKAKLALDPDATLTDLRGMDREAARDALDLHTIPELKALMPAGMPKSGKKRDLVDRLTNHLHPDDGGTPIEPSPTWRRLTETEADSLSTAQFSPDGSVVTSSGRTRTNLERDGFIDRQGRITAAGREALAAHQPSTFDASDAATELFGLRDDPAALGQALQGRNLTQLRAIFRTLREPEPGSLATSGSSDRPFRLPTNRADAPALRDALFKMLTRDRPSAMDRHTPIDEMSEREVAAETERRIRDAYARLARRPGGLVSLADLRDDVADLPRAHVDEVLKRLNRTRTVNVVPESAHSGPAYKLPRGVKQADVDEFQALAALGTKLDTDQYWRLDELTQSLPAAVRLRAVQDAHIEEHFAEFRGRNAPGTDPAQLRREMAASVKEAFKDKRVAVRVTPTGLGRLLDDGRFRTVHEHGKTESHDSSIRPASEEALFGLGSDSDPTKRPIYGYVMVEGERPAGDSDHDALSQYGQVQVVLKDSVRSRTTAMWGDSLDNHQFGRPSPIDDPTWESFTPSTGGVIGKWLSTMDRDPSNPKFQAATYAEAEVHGGVTVDDIAEVLLPADASPRLKAQLDAAGVPWRVPDAVPKADGGARRQTTALARGTDIVGDYTAADMKRLYPKSIKMSQSSDNYLEDIAHRQGFDGKPKLGTSADLDSVIAAGGVEVFRGVHAHASIEDGELRSTSADDLISQFEDGPAFYGRAAELGFGSGIYTTPDSSVAESYGKATRMVLDPRARVVTDAQLRRKSGTVRFSDPSVAEAIGGNPGRLAAALGYDAIHVEGSDQYVVLNRTALHVESPRATSGTKADGDQGSRLASRADTQWRPAGVTAADEQKLRAALKARRPITGMPGGDDVDYVEKLATENNNERLLGQFVERHPELRTRGAEKAKAVLAAKAKAAFADRAVAIGITSTALERVLRDGRFKTQLETGSSGGVYQPEDRIRHEREWFGTAPDADPADRPIYGYLASKTSGPKGVVAMYGDVQVVLHDDVRSRTTAMVGDSMDHVAEGAPSPVDDPDWRAFTPGADDHAHLPIGKLERNYDGAAFTRNGYIEAQVHGGVTAADIAEVVFGSAPSPELRALLEAQGIRWRTRRSGQ